MDIYISTTPDGKLVIKYEEDKAESGGGSDEWFGSSKKRKTKKRKSVKSSYDNAETLSNNEVIGGEM
jgi:hypothetical protein